MHLFRISGDVGFETVFLQISPGDSDEDTALYSNYRAI